jgi:putative transposase
MTTFKNKYRVETTRLKNWDYASAGYYFVTICTHKQESFFGEIVGGEMQLSVVGEQARQFWSDIPAHFKNVQLDDYVIMPNHLHGIIVIIETGQINVETRRGIVETRDRASLRPNKFGPLKPGSLPAIINAYKAALTRWCRKNGQSGFAWQARYYDHVIRNEESLHRIRQYIGNNPTRWEMDRNHASDLWM